VQKIETKLKSYSGKDINQGRKLIPKGCKYRREVVEGLEWKTIRKQEKTEWNVSHIDKNCPYLTVFLLF